ncbi:RNA-directed DNA methylation 4 isoform X2 [Malania oleifera]|uniref:RNA-directed DNA methylation 4 isoform X2 n=1 Tax=Malania oleifera TaxID=397392 RepID=UPI0025AE2E38|nr:RNA-directed DNA methylation 4 isoform X2 [Malania oleifera]
MASIGEGPSTPPKPADEKPVIVRVKRKAYQSRLEAFWLEINERPVKRALLDFERLSISGSSGKEPEGLKTKKLLVRHVETVHSSKATFEVLQSFVKPDFADALESKTKSVRRISNKENRKQGQLLFRARQEQQDLVKTARFKQIWRKREGSKGGLEGGEYKALHEACHFYDVVRIDVDETSKVVQQPEHLSLEDSMTLHSYLPLLREFLPDAAEEIESDIRGYMSSQESLDDFVYDLYAVEEDDAMRIDEAVPSPFPLVQVDEDDYFYAGPEESEYETDDSNAEDNPQNDYPDEETSEEEVESESSSDKLEKSESEGASESSSDNADILHRDEVIDDKDCSYQEDDYDADDFVYDDDYGFTEEDDYDSGGYN